MLIESATTRLAIDLLESLRKNKLIATDIRVSYISKGGQLTFRTFSNINSLKSFYQKEYGRIVASKRSPFTTDKRKALLIPIIKNGIIIGKETTPVNAGGGGLCELGRFMSVERFKLSSEAFHYDVVYNCLDVSDNYKITTGNSKDLRRNIARSEGVERQRNPIIESIEFYQLLLNKLFHSYNANLYVDLCYVEVGYVKESVGLYSLFFALIKGPIDSGLRKSVLRPRYLMK